jgi:hypothetical protein
MVHVLPLSDVFRHKGETTPYWTWPVLWLPPTPTAGVVAGQATGEREKKTTQQKLELSSISSSKKNKNYRHRRRSP